MFSAEIFKPIFISLIGSKYSGFYHLSLIIPISEILGSVLRLQFMVSALASLVLIIVLIKIIYGGCPSLFMKVHSSKENLKFFFLAVHLRHCVCVCVLYLLVPNLGCEGNGTLLQYSCLENPVDGEAW